MQPPPLPPSSRSDPLERPASLKVLQDLRRAGVVDDPTYDLLAAQLRPPAQWLEWVRLNLLLTGAALVLSGIVFFFAYNWQAIGRFEKLGLVAAAICLSILAAWRAGLDHTGGKVLTLAACVMTGVFLAVFGQIYQTGADPYELFTGWAALILPWVVLARFSGLWYFWFVLLNTGLGLFWAQVAHPAWGWQGQGLCLALAGLAAVALAAREFAQERGLAWLGGRWLRIILVVHVLGTLSTLALWTLTDGMDDGAESVLYVFAAWLPAVGGIYLWYRHRQPDFTCLALAAADFTGVTVFGLLRLLFGEHFREDGQGLFLLSCLIIVSATGGLTFWLTRIHRALNTASTHP